MTIYLYVKTHNKTGLKYFGKTTAKDPHKYPGSGTRWRHHLNKHGFDYSTEIVFESDDINDVKKHAQQLSAEWNVVESRQWANLVPEQGDGGGRVFDDEAKRMQSIAQRKRWKTYDSSERDKKISDTLKGRVCGDPKKKSISAKRRFADKENHPWTGKKRPTVTCPHCGKEGADFVMKRWHFSNCKLSREDP